jgi:hypothetical protein
MLDAISLECKNKRNPAMPRSERSKSESKSRGEKKEKQVQGAASIQQDAYYITNTVCTQH